MQEKDQGGKWSAREDTILSAQVRHLGANNWKEIARNFNSLTIRSGKRRTEKQCRDHWTKVLNVKVGDKKKLSIYEKLSLCSIWMKVGNKWREIAKLTGLSESRLKWCWKDMLKSKGIKVKNFSSDGLKVAVKRIIGELKDEMKNIKIAVPKMQSGMKAISAMMEPIDGLHKIKEETDECSGLMVDGSSGKIVNVQNVDQVYPHEEHKGSTKQRHYRVLKTQVEESPRSSSSVEEDIFEDCNNSDTNKSTIKLCDVSFNKEQIVTDSEDFNFALGTEENVEEGNFLPKVKPVKNFSTILTARMRRIKHL